MVNPTARTCRCSADGNASNELGAVVGELARFVDGMQPDAVREPARHPPRAGEAGLHREERGRAH